MASATADTLVAADFLYQRLNENLDLEVWPVGEAVGPYPYIVYELSPEADTLTKAGRIWSTIEGSVRVVGNGSPYALAEHVSRIEEAVGMVAGEVDGVHVTCRRIAPLSMPPVREEGAQEVIHDMGIRVRLRIGGGDSR